MRPIAWGGRSAMYSHLRQLVGPSGAPRCCPVGRVGLRAHPSSQFLKKGQGTGPTRQHRTKPCARSDPGGPKIEEALAAHLSAVASRSGRRRDNRRSAHPHFEFPDLLADGLGVEYDRRLRHLLHVMRIERARAPTMGHSHTWGAGILGYQTNGAQGMHAKHEGHP